MPVIKIDPEILSSASKQIATQITELNGFNGRLNALIDEIHDKWKGDASNKYYNLMLSYKQKAVQMESILAKFKQYADTTVNKFQTLDQECASYIRNSF